MIINLNPIAIDFGFITIHWYGLSYLVGFLGALFWARFVLKYWASNNMHGNVTHKTLDDVMSIVIIGVIVGGRMGEVILYHPKYYLNNPVDIIKIWQGGMSFHGGVIGVVMALWWFSKIKKIMFKAIGDMVCLGVPIGIFFGRIANFINGELWGRPIEEDYWISIPWAVIVPQSGSMILRHPSPIYEALLEGLLTFIILALAAKTGALSKLGRISGIFLFSYAVMRILTECYREPEVLHNVFIWGISWGQILSLPMLLIGLMLMFNNHTVK